uniref:Oxidoreductase NAD-binding domain-containing protein 1 n=1 Tax=Bos mutus grunniens TaxID=30521 RepID=A0A8B9WNG9_BOSMU
VASARPLAPLAESALRGERRRRELLSHLDLPGEGRKAEVLIHRVTLSSERRVACDRAALGCPGTARPLPQPSFSSEAREDLGESFSGWCCFCSSPCVCQRSRCDSRTRILHVSQPAVHLTAPKLSWTSEVVSAAKVCGVASESPSVKRLRLLVTDKDFSFKAGQWVDFFIPGVSVVGGFSICSSPRLLEQERMIELAVKHANHPPALWIHNQCTLDSEVAVRVGGEFFFDPQPTDASRNLVLIAGGVGINPLLSILRHAADLLRERASKGQGYEMGTVRLLYSAKDTSELLFKKNILDLVNEFPEKIACSLHVTKQTTQITADLRPYITEGGITQKEIRDHISKETLFYICGPPPMTDFFSKELESSHVPREHICFEKWW